MQMMVLNGLLSVLALCFTYQLIVHSDTVVSQSLSMCVIDAFADLQKFQVVLNGLFVLFDVIIQDTDWVVRPALISDLSCSSAAKSKHFIIFKSPHGTDKNTVVNFIVGGHCGDMIALGFIKTGLLFEMAWRGIEEKWEFDAMRLRRSHGLVVSGPVKVFNFILFGQWASDSERAVHGGLVHAVASGLSCIHW